MLADAKKSQAFFFRSSCHICYSVCSMMTARDSMGMYIQRKWNHKNPLFPMIGIIFWEPAEFWQRFLTGMGYQGAWAGVRSYRFQWMPAYRFQMR